MSTGVRVPLGLARDEAVRILELLGSGAERIAITGSIRRGAADGGDIEFVAIPRIEQVPDGMFGERHVNRLTELVDALFADGEFISHPTDPKRGERYSKVVDARSGLQIDLFSVLPPATWGVLLLIRTGPAAYSHALVTDARKRGFHVADGMLHRGGLGCGAYEGEVVDTPDEDAVYRALGLAWRAPEDRR